jgi:hypothetical protein
MHRANVTLSLLNPMLHGCTVTRFSSADEGVNFTFVLARWHCTYARSTCATALRSESGMHTPLHG